MGVPPVRDLLAYESRLWDRGYRAVGGIDEAGRGPLAGPVVSACVIFDPEVLIEGVYDSKALSAAARERLYGEIVSRARSYAVGLADNETVDRVNIYQATRLAMLRAVEGLSCVPDFLLTDAVRLDSMIPQEPVIKGDRKSFTIAAASIIAKVTRDRLMAELHREYPVYGWEKNKGYPTRDHRDAIRVHGFSPYHRKSFRAL